MSNHYYMNSLTLNIHKAANIILIFYLLGRGEFMNIFFLVNEFKQWMNFAHIQVVISQKSCRVLKFALATL